MNIWLFLSSPPKPAPAPPELHPIFAFGFQQDRFIPGQVVLSWSPLQLPSCSRGLSRTKIKDGKPHWLLAGSSPAHSLIDQQLGNHSPSGSSEATTISVYVGCFQYILYSFFPPYITLLFLKAHFKPDFFPFFLSSLHKLYSTK